MITFNKSGICKSVDAFFLVMSPTQLEQAGNSRVMLLFFHPPAQSHML